MFDYCELRGKVIARFKTQGVFAAKMGMSERSISLKLSGKRDWKQREIEKACELLDIEKSDIPSYFFSAYVQN